MSNHVNLPVPTLEQLNNEEKNIIRAANNLSSRIQRYIDTAEGEDQPARATLVCGEITRELGIRHSNLANVTRQFTYTADDGRIFQMDFDEMILDRRQPLSSPSSRRLNNILTCSQTLVNDEAVLCRNIPDTNIGETLSISDLETEIRQNERDIDKKAVIILFLKYAVARLIHTKYEEFRETEPDGNKMKFYRLLKRTEAFYTNMPLSTIRGRFMRATRLLKLVEVMGSGVLVLPKRISISYLERATREEWRKLIERVETVYTPERKLTLPPEIKNSELVTSLQLHDL